MSTESALASDLGYLEILTRIGAAAGIGFVVGLDREIKRRTLGLRTNMLVAIGAALFGVIAVEMVAGLGHGADKIRIDPSRIVEGIITGIGFLGGGAILQRRRGIAGGTTAAAIWVLGGIGLACGLGLFPAAFIGAGVLVLVLSVLGLVAGRSAEPEEPPGTPPES